MPVNITDPSALFKILAVEVPVVPQEGADPARKAIKHAIRVAEFLNFTTTGHQSFYDAVYSYDMHLGRMRSDSISEERKEELKRMFSKTIFGVGGNNRYYVREDGNIEFSRSHSSGNALERAKEQGFDIGP